MGDNKLLSSFCFGKRLRHTAHFSCRLRLEKAFCINCDVLRLSELPFFSGERFGSNNLGEEGDFVMELEDDAAVGDEGIHSPDFWWWSIDSLNIVV